MDLFVTERWLCVRGRRYPIDSVKAPTQLTLDKSIDPVAYTVFPMEAAGGPAGDFVHSPYTHGTDLQLRTLRQHYYAAVRHQPHSHLALPIRIDL